MEWRYWTEAHAANAPARFQEIVAPTLVFFASDDVCVCIENRDALTRVQQPHQRMELLVGYTHSGWTYDQAKHVVVQTADFLAAHLEDGIGEAWNGEQR